MILTTKKYARQNIMKKSVSAEKRTFEEGKKIVKKITHY